MTPSDVAVIGSGEMGHGIAQLAAMNGYDVVMRDIEEDIVEEGYRKIEWSLEKLEEKGTITEDPGEILERIETTTDLPAAVADVDAVIEAVPEDVGLKQDVFADLEEHAPEDAILASNTSGIPITDIAEGVENPERVVGMHFFNPVVFMNLIEIIRGEETSDETVETAVELSEGFDKEYVVVRKDVPGFITSRIISRYMAEGAYQYEETDASIEEIDSACKFGAGFPMGPFELADQTGLDIMMHGENTFDLEPAPVQKDLVDQGHYGKKTGKGFYDYEDGPGCTASPDLADEYDPLPIIAATVNEAARLVGWDVASAEEIDHAMKLATAYPQGPCRQGDDVGLDRILDAVEDNPRWETADYLEELVAAGKTGVEAGQGFYDYGDDEEAANGFSFETIDLEVGDDGVARLTLNRPMRQNALNPTLLLELAEAADDLKARINDDGGIRCLLIRGADGNFCAGGDITEFANLEPYEVVQRTDGPRKIEQLPIPTVAAIEGNCLGGGLELASVCDFRVASSNATLGQPEIGLGLIPGGGGTQRLPRLIGLAKAKELVMLGETVSAEEAKEFNLVTRVVEPADFEEEVDEFVTELAEGPPIAQKLAKFALHDAVDSPIEAGLTAEQYAFGLLLDTEDMQEGVEAFLGDREPDFQGK